ncbi:Sugar kinase of the NBD/HSP70 family, may contain an N-terminal HTH domain [Actinacidiphila yanglinensis]|uniref:Sugar kinase of the NBD/HSP70 family, may contain an N-terminal HTH domain n=1 Tax=Actinacidiphila yanglinensis TaxID=310779 RepID=A0A1H5XLM2_9ACTN|nr:ROK family transcriptional regulator [Actinacidiphila yanglinensis]SEG12669.1 Sugar kinase of the NBD/HSP70 family, may contain an N-terminal HTH domain [Actinacidiphila yanglinensis]
MAERARRTVRDLRRGNRASLLRHLYFEGPLSRQELGRDTGLSAGSISNVVGELIADGMVEEAGAVESDGGRPRILLQVAPGYGYLVGVDVGETRVRVELFDLALTELASADLPLSDSGHDVDLVVRLALEGIEAVVREAGIDDREVLGVGIGVPGIVEQGDPRETAPGEGHGIVVHGQTIGWDAVPLGRLLRAGTDLPLFIDNGAKTLGQAEMWFGGGRGSGNVVIALIGSGVGACVVADGRPYHGASSSAGEWGHTTLRVGGRTCRCGSRGCLEAYVGAEALLGRWPDAPQGVSEETALAALLAAGDDDPQVAALLAEAAEYLGAGIADLINLFNPQRIVLGGWAGLLLGPRLLPSVREVAAAYSLHHPCAQTSIELGRLGADAVTVGAATLPLARFLDTGGERPPRLPAQRPAGEGDAAGPGAGEETGGAGGGGSRSGSGSGDPVRNRIARAVR